MSGIIINSYLYESPSLVSYVDVAVSYNALIVNSQSVDGTTWYDESGNNFHGTLTNSPTWSPTGGPGVGLPGYFSFNGSNQHIEIANRAEIQLTTALSMVWWQRIDANAQINYAQIVGKGNEGYHARLASLDQTAMTIQVWDGSVSFGDVTTSTGYLTPFVNTWKMFMMRYDGTDVTLHTINGAGDAEQVLTLPYALGPEVNTTKYVYAAQDDYGTIRRWWRGDISGGLLFGSVLTTTQFENLYDASINGGVPPNQLSGFVHEPYIEYSFTTTDYTGDPYDVVAEATFTHTDTGTYTAPLYYSGSNTWKLRFTGPRVGYYTLSTTSTHSGLNGLTGSADVQANPDATAKGYLTSSGIKHAYLTGDGNSLNTFLNNIYLRHSSATSPDGVEQIAHLPIDSVARGVQIEALLTEIENHGMKSIFITGGHNWVQYPREYNQSSTNVYPDDTSFSIMEDLLQRAYDKGMFVHIWMWNDAGAGTASANLVGGINGSTDVRLQRYLVGRLGGYPNWELNYGYDLNEWVTEAQVQTWYSNMQSLSTIPRRYMARETEIGQVSDFTLGVNKLDVYAQDETNLSTGPYANAIDRFASSTGKPMLYLRRFLHTRDGVWTMEVTRRAIWQFTMAGGAGGVYGVIWTTPVNYPNPEQLKHIGDFWEERFKFPLLVDSTPTDGYVLYEGDVRQVVYKENTNSIDITIPVGQVDVPVVSLNTVGGTYTEVNEGLYSAGTHTISLSSTSDWALSIGDFGLTIPDLATQDPYDTVASSLGAVMLHNQTRSGGSWIDETVNGFDAAEINAPTWNASGGPGSNALGYYSFNGTNQRLDVTSSGVPSVLDFTGPFTMVWWQREDGTQASLSWNKILGKGEEGYGVSIYSTDDTNLAFIPSNTTATAVAQTGTGHTIINTWQMYMARWTGTDIDIYRIESGVATQVATNTSTVVPQTTISLFMYAAQDDREFGTSIRRYWRGDIAAVSVYGTSLTPTNFEDLYLATLG